MFEFLTRMITNTKIPETTTWTWSIVNNIKPKSKPRRVSLKPGYLARRARGQCLPQYDGKPLISK